MAIADFDSVGSFTVVPAGTYRVKIDSWKRMPASSMDKSPYIQWRYTILDGEFEGISINDFTTLSTAASWKVAKLIKTSGVDAHGKMDTETTQFSQLCTATVGQTLYVNVDVREGKNKVLEYAQDVQCQPKSSGVEDAPDWVKS